jgi:trimeric autotransporter adhesin
MSSSHKALLLLLAAALTACGGNGDQKPQPSNQAPVARVSVSPASGPAPLSVTVSGEASTDADGTISAYDWTFGDGASATGASAAHSYPTVGEFMVTLTVTDNQGATSSAKASVVVTGSVAVYNGAVYDGAAFESEPGSGTFDSTVLQ